MNGFLLHWDADTDVTISTEVTVNDSGDATFLAPGDEIYILSNRHGARLRGRIVVATVIHEPAMKRVRIGVSHPRTAFFAKKVADAPAVALAADAGGGHRQVMKVDEPTRLTLVEECAGCDFSTVVPPSMWPGIVESVRQTLDRRIRDGDERAAVHIATEFVRSKYYTTELPGPSPVYLNAARRSLLDILGADEGEDRSIVKSPRLRTRGVLDDGAIDVQVNGDVSQFLASPPDSSQHQAILRRLTERLRALGLTPLCDGSIDCIVELEDLDVYFEVKAASSPSSFEHQLRLSVGQVQFYMWRDRINPKPINGWIVIQNQPVSFDPQTFVASLGLGLCLDTGIDQLNVADLLLKSTSPVTQ